MYSAEMIVGPMDEELDVDDEPAVSRDGEGYTMRGNLPLDRINREIGWDLYDPAVVTLSGLLVSKPGRLLNAGDRVELEEGTAEVLQVRANRATSIRLRATRPKSQDPASIPAGGRDSDDAAQEE